MYQPGQWIRIGGTYLFLVQEFLEEFYIRGIFTCVNHTLETNIFIEPDGPTSPSFGINIKLKLEDIKSSVIDVFPIRVSVFRCLINRAEFPN